MKCPDCGSENVEKDYVVKHIFLGIKYACYRCMGCGKMFFEKEG